MTALLAIEALMQAAASATGLEDFGRGYFRENAQLLIDDAAASGPTPAGMEALRKRIVRLLENRLRLVDDRKRHPEIAVQQVTAPIVVLGLPRSGTTFLHSMLSQCPALRAPLQWEVSRPSPPPRAETFRTDPRIELSRREMAADPEMLKLHMQGAQLPVECGPVFAHEFMNTGNYAFWDAPNYVARVAGEKSADHLASAYRLHRESLQHFQAFAPPKRWVLKSPQHIGNLGALLAVYPDAILVFTHRDPARTLPSLSSFVAHLRARNYARVERARIGASLLDLWSAMMDRCLRHRADHPQLAPQIVDISYRQLLADPMDVACRVFERAGLDPSQRAIAPMRRWAERNRQNRYRARHGEHVYSAADFGLDDGAIAESFADYRRSFIESRTEAA